jgi:ribose transport system substrate-binding protein
MVARSLLAGLLPLLLVTSACRRDTKKVIGVIPQGRSHLFWQSIHAGAIAAARETGVEILWNAPTSETDYSGQLQVMDAMINRHVDAIAVSPIDRTIMVSVVERAASQNIPVIIYDTAIDTDKFVARVGTDNYAGGQLAGERLGKILNGKGKVLMVKCMPGSGSTLLREQGFQDTLAKDFPALQIVDARFGMSDFAKSLTVAENMLTAHPEADGMFASNETGSVGAAQALKGRQSKVKLVGFDWSPTLLEGLRAGAIDSLVVQNPFQMGYEAVMLAIRKLRGETPPKLNNLPPRLITRQNLDDPDVQKQLNPDLKKYLE